MGRQTLDTEDRLIYETISLSAWTEEGLLLFTAARYFRHPSHRPTAWLSPYASRFTTNHNCIWENLHLYSASLNNSCLLCSRVVIVRLLSKFILCLQRNTMLI